MNTKIIKLENVLANGDHTFMNKQKQCLRVTHDQLTQIDDWFASQHFPPCKSLDIAPPYSLIWANVSEQGAVFFPLVGLPQKAKELTCIYGTAILRLVPFELPEHRRQGGNDRYGVVSLEAFNMDAAETFDEYAKRLDKGVTR